ncbi:MAG: glycosyltransferase [Caulobacteraceae bacterium]
MRKGKTPPPRAKKPSKGDVLFIHSNFPGQFRDITTMMVKDGYRCVAIGGKPAPGMTGVPIVRWSHAKGTTPNIFPAAIRAEADLIRGRAAADAALHLKGQGFDPKLIIGHPGWGETTAMRQIWPNAKIILFGEFYYHAEGTDIDFDPEFEKPDFDRGYIGYAKNATLAMAYADADAIVCPTKFQASTLPEVFHSRVHIIHEGIDTRKARPNPDAKLTLPNGRVLDRSTPVVTHVNRHLEPLRGLHAYMRALPALMEAVPEAHAVVIGNESASGYGAKPPDSRTWKQFFWDEIKDRVDPTRVHFFGRTDHDTMISALQISAAHVYYTYPFVLSWSLLEALSCECLVVASDTKPLHEAITSGENGVLLDFFDTKALSGTLIEACRTPEKFSSIRRSARQTAVSRYDNTTHGLPEWKELIRRLTA